MVSPSPVQEVEILPRRLPGSLTIPQAAKGLVVFAHGSGSSRLSPRNRYVAEGLNKVGLATLLFDLLLPLEAEDRRNVFDIPLLASRLEQCLDWLRSGEMRTELPIGLFGASTGAAAALVAAARRPQEVAAIVSRGGRPDLAGETLALVRAPTLLIVGGRDDVVIELNEDAMAKLQCEKQLEIVPGATHLFQELGALDAVISLAANWFLRFSAEGGVP